MATNLGLYKESWKEEELCFTLLQHAIKAMLYEASTHPSPGLVSPKSCGAHKDMDYYDFLDSSAALIHPLYCCAKEGIETEDTKRLFSKLRGIGIAGEKRMFEATGGVNTHKGMLFLMGISIAASAYCIYRNISFINLSNIIAEMTEGLVREELEKSIIKNEALSHGEYLFSLYKTTGIRGEVERGMPTVFEEALPFYESMAQLSREERLVQTLLKLMSISEDSNVLYRRGPEGLNYVRASAEKALKLGGITTSEGRKYIAYMENSFKEKNISPGGSADLLAVTLFFSEIKIMFKGELQ